MSTSDSEQVNGLKALWRITLVVACLIITSAGLYSAADPCGLRVTPTETFSTACNARNFKPYWLERSDYSHVFLGSSRVASGIEPSVVEQYWGLSSGSVFNAGVGGATERDIRKMAEVIASKSSVTVLILEIDPLMFAPKGMAHELPSGFVLWLRRWGHIGRELAILLQSQSLENLRISMASIRGQAVNGEGRWGGQGRRLQNVDQMQMMKSGDLRCRVWSNVATRTAQALRHPISTSTATSLVEDVARTFLTVGSPDRSLIIYLGPIARDDSEFSSRWYAGLAVLKTAVSKALANQDGTLGDRLVFFPEFTEFGQQSASCKIPDSDFIDPLHYGPQLGGSISRELIPAIRQEE